MIIRSKTKTIKPNDDDTVLLDLETRLFNLMMVYRQENLTIYFTIGSEPYNKSIIIQSDLDALLARFRKALYNGYPITYQYSLW